MTKVDAPKDWVTARSDAQSLEEMLDADSKPAPEFLRNTHPEYLGSEPLDVDRYTSQEFFNQEVEKMWPRVWQMAGREEEIPNVGDFMVYENVGRSFLIARQEDGSIRAFYNACLHRGRKLKTEQGNAKRFKCPFHGFEWDLSGQLSDLPCGWDFPHLKAEEMALPEPKVETWAGFIFLNEDENAMPLKDYMAPTQEHFERWKLEDCFRAVYVGKVINANWKAVMEAFMEAWHSTETHPQITPYTGDTNSQYDIYSKHVNRMITPFGVPSPNIDMAKHDQQWIVNHFLGPDDAPKVEDGSNARAAMGDRNRNMFLTMGGHDASEVTDAEVQDAILYNIFPNFCPWGGFQPNIIYRWRPHGMDPNKCLMEIQLLMRTPKGMDRPKPAPLHLLGEDEPFANAPELQGLAAIFDQDLGNLPYVQEGMYALKGGKVNLANYQESKIRHFHQTLDKYLAD
ncbi:MAG: aromatic ring-hydroxylating oxygenase subunit alpha [Alphaproteobacteria bacterium]